MQKMLNKTLLCGAFMLAAAAPALAQYDVIRPEDEDLIADVINNTSSAKKEELFFIPEKSAAPAPKPKEAYQKEEAARTDTVTARPSSSDASFFPNRKEFEQERKEWYDPSLTHAEIPQSDNAAAPVNDKTNYYRGEINACLDNVEQKLEFEKDMLITDKNIENVSFLTQTFEEVNRCYEIIGLDIIDFYYNGDKALKDAFEKKSQTFYVQASQTDFNPKFCDETCSIEALINAQTEKFADFRAYLAELIANAKRKG